MTLKEKFYVWITSFIAGAVVVYLPLLYLIIAISLFMFLDFCAAIGSAIKKKEGFSWQLIINSVPKGIIYYVIIVAVFYCEIHWLPGTHISGVMCGGLCIRELKSINKHSKHILGEDVLSTVINSVKNVKR